jgi:SOS response regulatory protein OraA/RecX
VAARLLTRAPRTEAELETRLLALGYRAATAAATVARCRELGYAGDARFARERARGLRARGAGALRIESELTARGVAEPLVRDAVEASREGEREIDWARRALARLRADVSAPRERARAWRALAGRGFPEEVLQDLLGEP